MKPHICKFLVMYGTMLNELISKHVLMLRAVEFWTQFGLELQIFCSVIQNETYVLKRFQSYSSSPIVSVCYRICCFRMSKNQSK